MTPADAFVELDKNVHNRESFDCGVGQLNDFIRLYVARHRAVGISLTMVLPDERNSSGICAFYTLSHTEVRRENPPEPQDKKRLPSYPVPVLLLAELAVHKLAQGQGLGKISLIQALRHCHAINSYLPSFAVVVDALNDHAKSFYELYGFRLLEQESAPPRLYLPMKTVEGLFS